MRGLIIAWSMASLLIPVVAGAQDSVIVIDPDARVVRPLAPQTLPTGILAEAVHRYNDSAAARFAGSFELPAGARLSGPLAVFRGTLKVAGTIEGPVTVINGDMIIAPGGRVAGDILVVGGVLVVRPGGSHRGTERSYETIAEVYRNRDGLLEVREERKPLAELAAQKSFQVGDVHTTLKLSLGGTYNRVEGLPIYFAPIFEWRPSERDTVSLEVRGILRTSPDKSNLRKDLGYRINLGWRSIGGPRWSVDLTARSEIVGIETQPLSRSENGWSAFLLQRDYRDWFEAQGTGIRLGASPGRPLRLSVGLRYDAERSVIASDPWSLLRNSDRWRPNPLIDDGHYLTADLGIAVDTRNSTTFPSSGWYIQAAVEFSHSDDVAPLLLPPSIRDPIPTAGSYDFTRLAFDIRKYVRVSPGVRFSGRLFTAGWLGGDPLPVQRRYSLGGTDLLPGYRFRSVTCAPSGPANPSDAGLCNRVIAIQAEIRTRLDFGLAYHLRDRERAELDRIIAIDQADLVFLTDAGTAWIAGDGPGQVSTGKLPAGSQWKFDIGAGLDLGGVGIYLAKALTDDMPVRLTLRLQRRF